MFLTIKELQHVSGVAEKQQGPHIDTHRWRYRSIRQSRGGFAAPAACSSKVTEANYTKITDGMKEAQVATILGIASESRNTTVKVQDENYTSTQSKWRGDKGTIVVFSLNGEMQDKRFYGPGEEPKAERRC